MSDRGLDPAEQGTSPGVSRRELLAAGGAAAAAGLAGCVYHGPFPGTSLSVSVREPFEPDPPVAVPLRVVVSVQNVNSKDVALRGVELGLYDADRGRVAGRRLGDFSWRDAAPKRRRVSEYDSGFLTTTHAYSASWTLEPTLDAPEIPAWITFAVEEVWLGDDEAAQASLLPVGRAGASQPPAALTATIRRFDLGPPLPEAVDPDGYIDSRIEISAGPHGEAPLLPDPAPEAEPTTAEFWFPDAKDDHFETATEAFNAASEHAIEPEVESTSRIVRGAAGEFGDHRPHVFVADHTRVVDFAEAGHLSNEARSLDLRLEEAFAEPAIRAIHRGGRTYGLPYSTAPAALFYNRSMIEEPPETVAEWTARMERYHQPADGRYGLCYPLYHPYLYSAWAHAFGGYFYDESTDSLGLTSPETLRGIEFVVETLTAYTSQAPATRAEASVFLEGNAPFAVNRPAYLPDVLEAGIDVGVAPLPEPADGTPRPYSAIGTIYFTDEMAHSWKGAEGAPAARAFAEWYATTGDLLLQNALERGAVPVYRGAVERDDLPAPIAGFVEASETAIPEPPSSTMEVVYPRIHDAFGAVLAGERSAEDAFARAEDEITAAWNERRAE